VKLLRRRRLSLRPGDLVEVRPPAEILATLDARASLESVPFMPEMLGFVGRRFEVSRRAEKICDTAGRSLSSRRMHRTVFLDDLRCDGAGHDGCGAGCRIYWKEEWLRRVDEPRSEPSTPDPASVEHLAAMARSATRGARDVDGRRTDVYRCQATQALESTEPLRGFDLRQYAREVTSGNLGPFHVVFVLGRAIATRWLKRLGMVSSSPLRPVSTPALQPDRLDLQPGELVRIRPRDEIAATLDARSRCRGLYFGDEMTPYCGGTFRVRDRVERFIDETTGEMVELASDCLILDGVTCGGERSSWRFFCHRAIFPWWREAWLERVKAADGRPA
jgi:hypothetical protein